MDVKMPRRDGIDAASEVAAKRIAPIVVLTAFSQRDLVERARDAGAMADLVKPFTISDLIPAIESAVRRFSEISELEREVATLSERLETRKLVERAKRLLQTRHGTTEAGCNPVSWRIRNSTAMMRPAATAASADAKKMRWMPSSTTMQAPWC